MDSQGGNVFLWYRMKPVPWRAILRQSMEPGAQFERLSFGSGILGAAIGRAGSPAELAAPKSSVRTGN